MLEDAEASCGVICYTGIALADRFVIFGPRPWLRLLKLENTTDTTAVIVCGCRHFQPSFFTA